MIGKCMEFGKMAKWYDEVSSNLISGLQDATESDYIEQSAGRPLVLKGCPWIPQGTRVILRRRLEKKTKGGIIITQSSSVGMSEKRGIVVGVGGECMPWAKMLIGKYVEFGKFAGAWMNLDGKEIDDKSDEEERYYFINDVDILGEVIQQQEAK